MHIAIVSPTFDKEKYSLSTNAITAYTSHLVHALPLDPTDAVTILTTFSRGQNSSLSQLESAHRVVPIQRCFASSSLGLLQLLHSIIRTRPHVTHLQHETFLYGGSLSILLFPIVVWVMRLFTRPFVTLHHVVHPGTINTAFTRMQRSRLPPAVIRLGYRLFYGLLARSGVPVIVHEKAFQGTLSRCYRFPASRVHVIPHGIENPLPHARLSPSQCRQHFSIPSDATTVFGFFGSLSGYKGIQFLIEEFKAHTREHTNSVLLIAGYLHPSTPTQKDYSDFARKMKEKAERELPGRVIWHGPLSDTEIGDFFRCIDCLLLPYRTCFGQSGPLSYAIGSGTPFLASKVLAPIVPFSDLLFPLERGALCKRLNTFHVLPSEERADLRRRIASVGIKRSWNAVARQTYCTYKQVAAPVQHAPSIVLFGAFGQKNLGDELLLSQCLRHLPRSACVVVSSDPSDTAQQHRVAAIPQKGKPLALLRTLLHAHTIVVGGGDQFKLLKPIWKRPRHSLLFSCALLASFAHLFRKRVFFIGVGIGDIGTRLAQFLTQWALNRANGVLLRDAQSFHLAQHLTPRANITRGADLAFLQRVPRLHTHSTEIVRCGIAPCAHLDQENAFMLTTHEIAKATRAFLNEGLNHHSVFLPFQIGFSAHDDMLVSREIHSRVLLPERCTIEEQLRFTSVDAVYASLDFLWGMRLHSIILACLHAIPFIALVYDVKVQKFLEAIGCEQWGILLDSSFSAEKLMTLHEKLVQSSPAVRRHLSEQTNHLKRLAQNNAHLLHEIGADLPSSILDRSAAMTFDAVRCQFPGTEIQ